jgi:hypothetical protein
MGKERKEGYKNGKGINVFLNYLCSITALIR